MSSLSLERAFEPYSKGFSPLRKIALIGEITRAYARTRWLLARRDLREALVTVRAPVEDGVFFNATAHAHIARRLAEIVLRVLRFFPTDSPCLTRSVVLIDLLARRGIAPALVIGVTSEPKFEAHAWVELDGEALLPAYESKFARLVEL